MSQVNDETGNHRPVILSLKCMEKDQINFMATSTPVGSTTNVSAGAAVVTPAPEVATVQPVVAAQPAPILAPPAVVPSPKPRTNPLTEFTDDVMDTSPTNKDLEAKFPGVVLDGLEQFNTQELVGACVRLMSHDFDKDTLHAIMRVCLRLTRTFENAQIFAREGGIRLLLQMKQNSGYAGFTTLATLLIRHVIEEPKTLTLAMENVIFSRTAPNLPTGCKELLYMTRQMSSAISRNSHVFKEVAQQTLRIDVELLKRNQLNEDNRYLLKSLHPTGSKNFILEDQAAAQAVKDLLAALVQPDVPMSNNTAANAAKANNTKVYTSAESRAEQSNRSSESRFTERFVAAAAGQPSTSQGKFVFFL